MSKSSRSGGEFAPPAKTRASLTSSQMKLTPEDLQENAVDLLSAAMTNPLDRTWLREVAEALGKAQNIDLPAAYRDAARLAKGRDVEAPSLQDLLKGA